MTNTSQPDPPSPQGAPGEPGRTAQIVSLALIALVIVGIVIGSFVALRSDDSAGRGDATAATPEPTSPPPSPESPSPESPSAGVAEAPANTVGYGVVVGDPAAATTIRVYEDLQCPVCQQFEQIVHKPLRKGIGQGKVKVEYRIVSFLDRASTNEYSSRAANALLVVLDQAGPEAFVEFHKALFADQPDEGGAGFTDDELIDMAVRAGADEAAIRGPIEDKMYAAWIAEATNQMAVDGVRGTPTVFVDDEMIEGGPQDGVDAVLEAVR